MTGWTAFEKSFSKHRLYRAGRKAGNASLADR